MTVLFASCADMDMPWFLPDGKFAFIVTLPRDVALFDWGLMLAGISECL